MCLVRFVSADGWPTACRAAARRPPGLHHQSGMGSSVVGNGRRARPVVWNDQVRRDRLYRSLSLSVAPWVRVNTVAPGWIRTAWGRETASSYWERRAAQRSSTGAVGHAGGRRRDDWLAGQPSGTICQRADYRGQWWPPLLLRARRSATGSVTVGASHHGGRVRRRLLANQCWQNEQRPAAPNLDLAARPVLPHSRTPSCTRESCRGRAHSTTGC